MSKYSFFWVIDAIYVNKNFESLTLRKIPSRSTGEHTQYFFKARFPVKTIWNGHSLLEPDAPDDFRQKMKEKIKIAEKIFSMSDECLPDILKQEFDKVRKEIFHFLSCLHQDAPSIVSEKLLKEVQSKEGFCDYKESIGYAIGSVIQPWQQELWKKVITFVEDTDERVQSCAMEVLSIALWHSKELIDSLKKDTFDSLVTKNLLRVLQKNKLVLKNSLQISRYLELLLALLRMRAREDRFFKEILAPNKELTEKYRKVVKDILDRVVKKNIELKSYISFDLEKPLGFEKTPDLLYALDMYLTGDNKANTISIIGTDDVV